MDNLNDLLLLSGNDIPFIEAQIAIHQPTIKEIAYVGEEAFFTGLELVNFSKNILSEEDKMNLEDKSNFDILIAILRERNAVMQKNRNCVEMVLALLFPHCTINLTKDSIVLTDVGTQEQHVINNDNFEIFKIIVNKMFAFKSNEMTDYNPGGDLAKKIADKLRERRAKLAKESANENKKIDILSRYVSILTIGNSQDMNHLLDYTVYQLFDAYMRYQLKVAYDINLQARMAGAKDLKEVEDWMKDIHSE